MSALPFSVVLLMAAITPAAADDSAARVFPSEARNLVLSQGRDPSPSAQENTVIRRGEAIYARCGACHAIDFDRTGPRHCGLFGRRAGSVPGFDYSAAMKRSGLTWNAQTLDRFIADPLHTVPGTTMTYAGVADAQERADLIAYLSVATRQCARAPVK